MMQLRKRPRTATKNLKQVLDNPNGDGSIGLVVSHKDVDDWTAP
jgi:hypothetical protein